MNITLHSPQDEIEQLKDELARSNGVVTPQNYFVQVPNSFIRNGNIGSDEKLMYIYLWGFGGISKQMYPSQARMIKELGWSKSKVIRVLQTLEAKGGVYILNRVKLEKKEKATNLYYLAEIDTNDGNFQEKSLEKVKVAYPTKIMYI